jgi:uncharacterized membrane protein YgdD (TMEM256/DUF423 family)
MQKDLFKPALNAAIIFGLLGVILGAMGAHALQPPVLSEKLHGAYETAVRYQFYHSFALLFTALLYFIFPDKWIKRATWAFIIGIILFSGSIYLLVYLEGVMNVNPGMLGILTPIGGLFFITGWLFLLLGINSRKQKQKREETEKITS